MSSKSGGGKKRDWSAYNKSLIERGSLTVWIDEEALAQWAAEDDPFHIGRPFVYSENRSLCESSCDES